MTVEPGVLYEEKPYTEFRR